MSLDSPHIRLLRLATLASLGVTVILIVGKTIAWWLSSSISLLTDLTDPLLGSAALLLNLLTMHYSPRSADDDHRYDHGKTGTLAGLAQAMFTGVSAVLVAIQAVEQLRGPQPLDTAAWGIAVMLPSLLLAALPLAFQTRVIRHTGSTTIHADSLHYRSDPLLNASTLVVLLLTRYGWPQNDDLFDLGIILYILQNTLRIARGSVSVPTDRELLADASEHMREFAYSVPGVLGTHDARTWIPGNHWFVQLHLELLGELNLSATYALTDRATLAIKREYPKIEVLIRVDPQEVVGKETVS